MQQPHPISNDVSIPSQNIVFISTSNVESINKVLAQQIIEIIRQTTYKNLQYNPQMMLDIEPMVLELYQQVTRYIFNLEAEEYRCTGQITHFPELKQVVATTWENVWRSYEQLHGK